MGDLLSQSEIDSLIGAIRSGRIAEDAPADGERARRIRVYDFRRPDRFSKDQLRTISMIHGTFARLAGTALSLHLRFPVNITLRSVDQLAYEEFVRSIPPPTVLLLVEMGPLDGRAIIEINNGLALLFVDRLLGGVGIVSGLSRPLTELERGLMARVADKLLPALGEAWTSVAEVTPALAGQETNPQFAQIAAPRDIVLLITLEVQTPHQTNTVNLVLPYLLLQPILSRLSATTLFRAAARGNREDDVRSILNEVSVPVRVELGRARVTVRELADLTQDDVIRLERPALGTLDLYVGNQLTFVARPGRVRRRLAVEVVGMRGGAD